MIEFRVAETTATSNPCFVWGQEKSCLNEAVWGIHPNWLFCLLVVNRWVGLVHASPRYYFLTHPSIRFSLKVTNDLNSCPVSLIVPLRKITTNNPLVSREGAASAISWTDFVTANLALVTLARWFQLLWVFYLSISDNFDLSWAKSEVVANPYFPGCHESPYAVRGWILKRSFYRTISRGMVWLPSGFSYDGSSC